ncbi:MAG: hypothetical protein R3213_00835 [Flavobacteriaceae bacterium]|nr:hypothetical protein [Flavobacteriaceae bacterium]
MLELILFLLPGFCSIVFFTKKNSEVKKINTDYWIFISLSALLTLCSICLSDLVIKLVVFTFARVSLIQSYTPQINDVFSYLYLNKVVLLQTFSLADYLVSFFVSMWLIFKFKVFTSYIDGTEEFDTFLEHLMEEKSNNTAMITLDSGKVYIGPIVGGDIHKKTDNQSITIHPIMSGRKNEDGKLEIKTDNISFELDNGALLYEERYRDLKTNIPVNKVSHISKFVLAAFLDYLEDDKIHIENEQVAEVFMLMSEILRKSEEI